MRNAANQKPAVAACPVSVPMFQVFVIARSRKISVTDPRNSSSSTTTDGKTLLSLRAVSGVSPVRAPRAHLMGHVWC